MFSQRPNTPSNDSVSRAEHPVTFRFPVTWTCLSTPFELPEIQEPERIPSSLPAPVPTVHNFADATTFSPRARLETSIAAPIAPPLAAARWEMVVPKMSRSPRASAALPPPTESSADDTAGARRPVKRSKGAARFAMSPSNLSKSSLDNWNAPTSSGISLQLKSAMVVAGLIGVIIWVSPKGSSSATAGDVSPSSAGRWIREASSLGTAAKQGRQLFLYHTPQKVSDYRIEFDWTPDAKGAGWIYRTLDANNHYIARIGRSSSGASLVAEHSAMVSGVETGRVRKWVAWTGSHATVRVRLDAAGPVFALYVQGVQADRWTDSRFAAGEVGFFEDRGGPPSIETVALSFLKPPARGYTGSFQNLARSLE